MSEEKTELLSEKNRVLRSLSAIARAAQKLDVTPVIGATECQRLDVIDVEPPTDRSPAIGASLLLFRQYLGNIIFRKMSFSLGSPSSRRLLGLSHLNAVLLLISGIYLLGSLRIVFSPLVDRFSTAFLICCVFSSLGCFIFFVIWMIAEFRPDGIASPSFFRFCAFRRGVRAEPFAILSAPLFGIGFPAFAHIGNVFRNPAIGSRFCFFWVGQTPRFYVCGTLCLARGFVYYFVSHLEVLSQLVRGIGWPARAANAPNYAMGGV